MIDELLNFSNSNDQSFDLMMILDNPIFFSFNQNLLYKYVLILMKILNNFFSADDKYFSSKEGCFLKLLK